jgi:hypothetical protein
MIRDDRRHAPTVATLRAMTDEEIIRVHDETMQNTGVNSSFYLDELRRRDAVRAEAASQELATQSHNLAKRTYLLAMASFVVAAVAAAAAVAAIWVSIAQAHSNTCASASVGHIGSAGNQIVPARV